MSDDTVEIIYLDWNEKIKKCSSYKEFLSELIYHFYLSQSEESRIELFYFDDEEDLNNISNEEDYNQSLNYPHPKYLLKIQEIKKKEIDINESCNKLLSQKEKILNQINDYKKKLVEHCSKIIQQKLKEKDEQLEKEINNLEKFYQESLDKFKDNIKSDTENVLAKIKENFVKLLNEKTKEYDTNIKEDLNTELEKISEKFIEEIDQIKIEDMQKEQENMYSLLQESTKTFKEIEQL